MEIDIQKRSKYKRTAHKMKYWEESGYLSERFWGWFGWFGRRSGSLVEFEQKQKAKWEEEEEQEEAAPTP